MRSFCALLLLAACPLGAVAQTTSPAFATKGAFFGLSVADLNTSTRWYEEKLGLKVVMRLPKKDKVAVAILEGGGLMVELVERDDALPLRQTEKKIGRDGQI